MNVQAFTSIPREHGLPIDSRTADEVAPHQPTAHASGTAAKAASTRRACGERTCLAGYGGTTVSDGRSGATRRVINEAAAMDAAHAVLHGEFTGPGVTAVTQWKIRSKCLAYPRWGCGGNVWWPWLIARTLRTATGDRSAARLGAATRGTRSPDRRCVKVSRAGRFGPIGNSRIIARFHGLGLRRRVMDNRAGTDDNVIAARRGCPVRRNAGCRNRQ
jgi:hypothetical protein